MATAHNFAFVTGIPMTGAMVTLDSAGAVLGTGCRIVGDLEYSSNNRIKNEDINESGLLVGERRNDLEESLSFSVKLPTTFSIAHMARFKQGHLCTVALVTVDQAEQYNGAWQIDDVSEMWKSDDAMAVRLKLRRNANMTLSAQGA